VLGLRTPNRSLTLACAKAVINCAVSLSWFCSFGEGLLALFLEAGREIASKPGGDVSDFDGGQRSADGFHRAIGDRRRHSQYAFGVAVLVGSLKLFAFANQ